MRFSIRDLFWLVLVAGIGCAWWLDRERINTAAQQDREVILRFKAAGIDPGTFLQKLTNHPPRPTIIRLKSQFSTTKGFGHNSDFQAPPQRPGTWIERIERQSSEDLPDRP